MLDFLMVVSDIELYVAFGLAVIFTTGYMLFFNWRKTAAGRSIFYLFLSWVVITIVSLISTWLGPDYFLRPVWRFLAWSFVVFTLSNLLWVLWRSFRKHEHPLAYVEPRHTEEIPILRKETDDGSSR